MSMKEELEIWVSALHHYDAQEFEVAIETFGPIADTSKILFNCGVIRATLGQHEAAIEYYQRATSLDQYLAIAYFQQGVSSFLIGDFEEALANFNDTLLYLRGNKFIDYDQLGLKYKLHSCEVLFNRGLCYIYLQQVEAGLKDMEFAVKEKATQDHDVIDEAIKEKAEGYTVFSIPVGLIFRPNEAKVKNVRARDYLGKARLVAQANGASTHRRKVSSESWAKDDRPAENVSFAATHLIRSGLSSRSRQQSEPPINRNYFPPTPPPEAAPRRQSPDGGNGGRSQSLSRRPEPLNLGAAAFEKPANGTLHKKQSQQQLQDQPQQQQTQQTTQHENFSRPKVARSASERPSERRPHADRSSQDSGKYSNNFISPSREKLFGSIDHDGQSAEVAARLSASSHTRSNSAKSTTYPRQQWQQRPEFIKEEEDEGQNGSPYNHDFRSSTSTSTSRYPEVRDDGDARSSYSRSGYRGSQSRRPAAGVTKIRIKVHFGDDTRFIIVTPSITFGELLEQVGRKFAIGSGGGGGVTIKTRDEEGDMITMGDQDDLDMAVTMCKELSAKEGSDMGKLEFWVSAR